MKLVRRISIFPIILCLLAVAALADSKQKQEITLSKHVMVSSTQLKPGDYVVQWEGSGPDVKVKFMRQGEEVASTTGKVIQQKNRHSSFTTSEGKDGSRVLTEITFSDVTLVLTAGEPTTSE